MKRPAINITPAERIGRIFMGLVGVMGGLVLLGSASLGTARSSTSWVTRPDR